MPAVSVIIAALRAQAFLGEALDSVLAQSFSDFEIVVAPDEPADYSGFAARDRRIHVLPGVPRPTGAGPARNRALARARGDWIALLDADDLWSEDYLAILLPLARSHAAAGREGRRGAAFGRTSIETMAVGTARLSGGALATLRSVPAIGAKGPANFALFAGAYASFHGVTQRQGRSWRNVFAEDVLFDIETLALAGGEAPYAGDAVYRLRLRPASTTADPAFERAIDHEYWVIRDIIEQGATEIPSPFRNAAGAVFESWQKMNARFLRERSTFPDLAYQNFIAGLKH